MRWVYLLFVGLVISCSTGLGQVPGAIDPSFLPGAAGAGTVECLALQPDGRLLVGGTFRSFDGQTVSGLVRLNPDGSIDPNFRAAFTLPEGGGIFAVAVQADGRVLAGGLFTATGDQGRRSLVRLNSDGSLDAGFNPAFEVGSAVSAVTVMADGAVFAGGVYVDAQLQVRLRLQKLRANGSVDPSFAFATGFLDGTVISRILPSADGSLLVAGAFRISPVGVPIFASLMRVSGSGQLVQDFNAREAVGAAVGLSAVVELPDRSLLVAGEFSGTSDRALCVRRLLPSGAYDARFAPRFTKTSGPPVVDALAVQPDGRIVVVGDFEAVNGVSRTGLARLLADGTLDTRFAPEAQANAEVIDVVLSAEGRPVVGGSFTSVAGAARGGVARLLNPLLPPKIVTPPAAATIRAGGNVRLAVVTEGGASDTYQWLLNGVEIPNSNTASLYQFDVRSSGQYSVRVMNAAGTATSPAVVVTVNPRVPGGKDEEFHPEIPTSSNPVQQYERRVIPLPDGRMYVHSRWLSNSDLRLLRADGSLQTTFQFSPYYDPYHIDGGVGLPDGSVYLYGQLPATFPADRNRLARLRSDGQVDANFTPGVVLTAVADLALAKEGLYVAGTATVNGHAAPLVRLQASGAVDPAFAPPAELRRALMLTVRSDGTVYVQGEFATATGDVKSTIVRLRTDGSVDPAFSPEGDISSMAVSPGGAVFAYMGQRVRRLLANGAADPAFSLRIEKVEYRREGRLRLAYDVAPQQMLALPDGSLLLQASDEVNGQAVWGPVRVSPAGVLEHNVLAWPGAMAVPRIVDDGCGGWLMVDLGGTVGLGGNQISVGLARLFQTGPSETRLANLAARAFVGVGEQVLITGFVTSGGGTRTLLVRGIGPALAGQGIRQALAAPVLELYHQGVRVASNQGWNAPPGTGLAAAFSRLGAFALAENSRDTALWQALPTGVYSAMVSRTDERGGVALVECYDDGSADNPGTRLANLSARAYTAEGENVLTGGFVVTGSGEKQLLIRAVGPGLRSLGIEGAARDPSLRVLRNGAAVAESDDWSDQHNADFIAGAAQQVGAFPLLAGSKDAALLTALPAGAYTVTVEPGTGGAGVALVEIYEVSR
jgi:uncharacterized delta-60 repeat protein